MVKKSILITLLVLMSVQSSIAVPWTNFFRSAASKAFAFAKDKGRTLGSYMKNNPDKTLHVLNQLVIGEAVALCGYDGYCQIKKNENLKKKSPFKEPQAITYKMVEKGQDRLLCLNDNYKARPIIDEVLDTYGFLDKDFNKDIKFYYHPGLNKWNKNLIDAHAASQSNVIQLIGKECTNAFLEPSHPKHEAVKSIMGHEIGHIVHNHKGLGYLQCYVAGATSAGGLLLLSLAKMRSIYGIGLIVCYGKYFIDSIVPYAWSRHQEREADEHVIQHATNPKGLRAMGEYFAEEHKDAPQKNSIKYFLTSIHPLSSERAMYFNKAAEELEKKRASAEKKSNWYTNCWHSIQRVFQRA